MRIDIELEASRQIRDKLGGAAEQWRTSANLLRTSAKSALIAKEQYAIIRTSRYRYLLSDLHFRIKFNFILLTAR